MRVTRNKWWNHLTSPIVGFDEPGEGASGEGAGEGAQGTQEGAGEGQGSEGNPPAGEGASEDVSGLKSALQKERDEKKALEKELKTFRKAKDDKDLAEKSEIEQATTKAQRAEEKATKLAAGFRNSAVRTAVLEAAGKAKFRDPSDALRPEVIDAIGVEQDEDDPTKVTIDQASVTNAIKALAAAKKHYIASPNEGVGQQRTKSGSSFGGSGKDTNRSAEQQALVNRYPALRSRIH